MASLPFFGHLYHADVWWVAFLNEILGLIALVGVLFMVYRRYVQRDSQLRTMPADTIVIVLLALIAFSGFPTETFRLLAAYTTPAGVFTPSPTMIPPDKLPPALYGVWGPQWAFLGYLSALIWGRSGWTQVSGKHCTASLSGGILSLSVLLLFYLPFSRFFHVIMSPVIVAYNTVLDQEAHSDRQQRRSRDASAGGVKGGIGMERNEKKLDLANFTLRQMMEMEACTRCGECIETCPTFAEARIEEIHPLQKISLTKRFWKADHLGFLARLFGLRRPTEEELGSFSQGVYQCTLCARCHVVCPVQIETRPLWISMREQLVDWGLYPEAFGLLQRAGHQPT